MKALVISLVVTLIAMCNPTAELSEGVCLYSSDNKYISIGDRADSASVAELFGEPQRVVRFTDDEALCGEVERIEYDSAVVTLLDGVVYEFGAWNDGARMSINGLCVEVGMAHADINVGEKFEHRYFAERGCGYIFMRCADGGLIDDYLIYSLDDECVASVTWHVPI